MEEVLNTLPASSLKMYLKRRRRSCCWGRRRCESRALKRPLARKSHAAAGECMQHSRASEAGLRGY
jgi:hypothetical protein